MRTLIVPFGVVAVLASMLLPVPPTVLDFLLIANLLLALLLLLSTLYISEPLKLSALPTILLLATIYRLALNVASTRLILSDASAGEVIHIFGTVVAQGNLMVGAVVFVVITLVQFIVISKGSERVAEVAARFTLDALPGKQMSIDADVRAGLLDMLSAREKRQELQTESRFYGALDGAMKFVKGDAIAGVIIVVVNIIGGLVSGIMVHNLSLTQALTKYTILTIGDGLVSQIPSLLNSLAAGMVVTRVIRGDGVPLAIELVGQLQQQRNVLVVLGGAAVLLGVFSGLPSVPLMVMGLALISPVFFKPTEKESAHARTPEQFVPRVPSALGIELPPEYISALLKNGKVSQAGERFRKEFFEKTGLILALPDLRAVSGSQVHFKLRGVNAIKINLSAQQPDLEQQLWGQFSSFAFERAAELVDDVLTRRTLDAFDAQAPELVSSVVPGLVSVTQLTEILRALVREQICVSNFDLILQAVAEATPRVSGERMILEEVRIALKRVICAKHLDPDGKIRAYALDALLDLSIGKIERANQELEIELQKQVLECVESVAPKLIVCSRAARRSLSDLLKLKELAITVLAFEEISSDVQLEILGKVALKDPSFTSLLEERLAA